MCVHSALVSRGKSAVLQKNCLYYTILQQYKIFTTSVYTMRAKQFDFIRLSFAFTFIGVCIGFCVCVLMCVYVFI